MSRKPISTLCLILCVALTWGVWKLSATADATAPLPDLRMLRAHPATARRPPKNRSARGTAQPAEKMPMIRVGLSDEPARSLSIEVSEAFTVRALGADKILFESGSIGPTTVSATKGGMKFGKRELAASGVEIVPAKSPAVWVAGHQYRGTVRIHRQGALLQPVNVLPLEDYVASVLDSEMPAAFPDEARQAQAVVARTYALYQKEVVEPTALADLFASTRSQKYLGYRYRDGGRLLAGETDTGRRIAAATRGKVCHYRGKIFCTYYCAVCGGSTVKGTDVFADAAPLIVSVKCDFCREAKLYRWTAEISKSDMQKELEPWFRENGQKPGLIKTVSRVRSSAAGGTISEFDLKVDQRSVRISAIDLREALSGHGLSSPQFTIADKGRSFDFAGRGHGHGVGLCQWGARGQALEGKKYEQILSYYYPGSTLVTRVWK